ncbi:alpha-amylase family glycosyl hydrolase [Haliangium ochraceum]|uniref:Alpha amylase catalytic region n=1 Tax=Haliangium ochraceum (strain DSM 14365 / JCM 11303 / SMP-2) TaxID=502025 RepID=D0LM79_HALO1|nr:alpha-amylase family glycosyl hydrolase [Haliangium ochraceum]ACY16785.1 alpha amylase catalytic region [Haliangium ochraceum DSM 14365]
MFAHRSPLYLLASAGALAAACGVSSQTPPPPPAPAPAPQDGDIGDGDAVVQWDHDWARGAVFYEVFVRSFQDSDGDGVGDLRGLIDRLDYLNDGDPTTTSDLGVDGLWLMPVFESPSYHGYDVVDYERIERDYGDEDDFRRLCAEAERRGMRVIVDLVMNHTSAQHPWFQSAAQGPAAAHRDFYVWRADDPGWQRPWGEGGDTWHRTPAGEDFYYGIFWGGMPDLNFRNPAVLAEMQRIAGLWLERGAAGFRLDATRYLVANGAGELQADQSQTHDALRAFSASVRERAPAAMLVGENWTAARAIASYYGDTARVRGGDELPASFDFPLADAIVSGVRTGVASAVYRAFADHERFYPGGVLGAPFLRNHDQIRLASDVDGDPARLRQAAAILLTLPGMPFLYYGEELGMENGPGVQDESKRTPMPWSDAPGGGFTQGTPWHAFAPGRERANVAAQQAAPDSLLSHYRRWIGLRKASHALRRGLLEALPASPSAGLVYVRASAQQRALVVHNLGEHARAIGPLPASLPLAQARSLTGATHALMRAHEDPGATAKATPADADADAGAAAEDAPWWLLLPPHGSEVLVLEP